VPTSPFNIGYGIGWDNKTIGTNPTNIRDLSNSWVQNLKLEKSKFALSEYRSDFSWSEIRGIDSVSTDVITISGDTYMNTIYFNTRINRINNRYKQLFKWHNNNNSR